jgi:hypothetical protein
LAASSEPKKSIRTASLRYESVNFADLDVEFEDEVKEVVCNSFHYFKTVYSELRTAKTDVLRVICMEFSCSEMLAYFGMPKFDNLEVNSRGE